MKHAYTIDVLENPEEAKKEIRELIKPFSLGVKLSPENLGKLEAIQKIILFEEGQENTLDEVLARILKFYSNFVPH